MQITPHLLKVFRSCRCSVLLLLVFAANGRGQTVPISPTVSLPRTIDSSPTSTVQQGAVLPTPGIGLLGAGDQLVVNVADLDEVRHLAVKINSDGTLDLPLIGVVRASGLTVPDLRQLLAGRFAKYVTEPQVSIQVTSSQNQTVSVLGQVAAPGVQEINGPLTLLGALSKAGGIKADAGYQVIVTRDARSGTLPLPPALQTESSGFYRAALPLDDLLAGRMPQDNIALQAGDVVTVPKGNIVYVVGQVHRAGGFPLKSTGHISLIEAVALAEGIAPNAKSGNAKVLRLTSPTSDERKEIPVDIDKILSGKQPDIQLVADDILFVPNSAAKSGARRVAEAALQLTTGILIYR